MRDDRDLSPLLPAAPPPRPARRDAAIEAAMRRFDGADPPPPRRTTKPARSARWGWPQMGVLVTAGLVAVVSVPFWLSGDPRIIPARRPALPVTLNSPADRSPPEARSPMSSTLAAQAPDPTRSASSTPAATLDPPGEEPRAAREQSGADFADMALPPPPPPPPSPPPPPPPPSAIAAAPAPLAARVAEADDSADNIVVTGSRVSVSSSRRAERLRQGPTARDATTRGDWNACTVNDPSPNLAACKRLVDPAAPGADGRAAAHTADGLSRAWSGDAKGAIAAFDQAILLSGKSSFAYLNRALAYERSSDLDRAIADLDRAVRYAPDTARSYYHRSLARRQRGQIADAQADARRAIALDPAYEMVID